MTQTPDMHTREQIEMMQRCSSEIKQLRAQIAQLQPKADAYDNMAALIGMFPFPRPSRGYGEDLAWVLDKRIETLRATLEKPAAKPSPELAEGGEQ